MNDDDNATPSNQKAAPNVAVKDNENSPSGNQKDSVNYAKWAAIGVIATALFGAIATSVAAYFGYLQVVTPTQLQVTQTVEAKLTAAASSAGTLTPPAPASLSATEIVTDGLSLDDLPFYVFSWAGADISQETGWAQLSVINDPSSGKAYHLEYSLPMTSTQYSGVGLVFKFDDLHNSTSYDPQDLSAYNYALVEVAFGTPDTRCEFFLSDISTKSPSISLSPQITLGQDIERRSSGLTETFVIPLDEYFADVSRKDISEVAFATDTQISPGNHKFTVNRIEFLK